MVRVQSAHQGMAAIQRQVLGRQSSAKDVTSNTPPSSAAKVVRSLSTNAAEAGHNRDTKHQIHNADPKSSSMLTAQAPYHDQDSKQQYDQVNDDEIEAKMAEVYELMNSVDRTCEKIDQLYNQHATFVHADFGDCLETLFNIADTTDQQPGHQTQHNTHPPRGYKTNARSNVKGSPLSDENCDEIDIDYFVEHLFDDAVPVRDDVDEIDIDEFVKHLFDDETGTGAGRTVPAPTFPNITIQNKAITNRSYADIVKSTHSIMEDHIDIDYFVAHLFDEEVVIQDQIEIDEFVKHLFDDEPTVMVPTSPHTTTEQKAITSRSYADIVTNTHSTIEDHVDIDYFVAHLFDDDKITVKSQEQIEIEEFVKHLFDDEPTVMIPLTSPTTTIENKAITTRSYADIVKGTNSSAKIESAYTKAAAAIHSLWATTFGKGALLPRGKTGSGSSVKGKKNGGPGWKRGRRGKFRVKEVVRRGSF
ncbi:hypothetical protein HDU76_001980 [Blyttiomyces sp. JEL0837]|nr:hypothetical protein HDU76_001980 [Blyttiomyces sp. JEL0837]